MSSNTTESLKQQSEEPSAGEPTSKKVKIDNENSTTVIGLTNAASKTDTDQNDNIEQRKATNDSLNGDANDNDGADEDDIEGTNLMDPKVTKSLEEVEGIQGELFKLNEKASEEILKVEQKFNQLRRPHFSKRAQFLKSIPNFWLTTLANHHSIAPMIESAEDENCLHYLVDLDVEEFDDIKSGYRIKLHFKENPYIANESIVKEFQIVSSEETVSALTPIEFKNTPQGESLKQVVDNSLAQYRRSRRPGQTHQSFFGWLAEPSEPGTDEIAEILKDQIWPNPLEFFFAQGTDYEAGTDESDDEDEEIDDEEIDDEEDGLIAAGIDIEDEDLEGEGDEDEEDDVDDDDVE